MTSRGFRTPTDAALHHATGLRSDAYALNTCEASILRPIFETLDNDDVAFFGLVSVLLLLATLSSRLLRARRGAR